MKLYLFDEHAPPFRPLSWTRPLCELLFGAETFRERLIRVSGMELVGVFAPGRFEGLPFSRLGASPLRINPREPGADQVVVLDSLYVPAGRNDAAFGQVPGLARFWAGGMLVGARLPAREARAVFEGLLAREDWREVTRGGADVELPGRRPETLYRLVAENAQQISSDLADSRSSGDGAPPPASELDSTAKSRGLGIEGPAERLHVSPEAELVAPIHVDLRAGSVRVEKGARIEPFTLLRGPLVVRAGAHILGGEIGAGTTVGRDCRIRGEIQNSIILGLSNKAHEGFVGDSYLGEWVNLGAGTTTSNLKNNYGLVRQRLAKEVVETGLLKLGSLIGDHVKTGIGSLLPTGCWIGPGTNLYGSGDPAPQFIPAFSWGSGTRQETHRLEAFLESAKRAMARRGQTLDAEEAGMLGVVFRATQQDRLPTLDRVPV
jgi:UDP-N-acetylglucosamine diphosphorylase/glucosamine-1-phosphate N-acetyltransferase